MTDTTTASTSSSAATVIGVDVGGTGIKAAPVDLAGGALAEERRRIPTPHPATPAAVTETIAVLVNGIASPGPVGVTLPAVVRGGVALTAANIDPTWIGTDAVKLIGDATGREVTVLNDADAAGLAEIHHGAGKGVQGVVLMLTLGTGIGSALFVDGRLVPNSELGHLPLHDGVAEDWAAASVRENEDLGWKTWAGRLEEYVQLVEQLLWPDLIIIGGGVSKKADRFLPRISSTTPLVPAELHNDAGIVGAAMATQA